LFLEERNFAICGSPDEGLVSAIEPFLLHPETRKALRDRIAVVNDDDFAWFARYGLAVQARNVLERETKKSTNLWYEETLPPDTVMYALVAARSDTALEALDTMFPEADPYIQLGGNETVGQGWFAVSKRDTEAGGGA
jgi:CRISPR-associated protein Cmr4